MFLKKVTSSCFLMLLCACSSTQQTAEAPQSREDKIKLGFGSLAGPEGIALTKSADALTIQQDMW